MGRGSQQGEETNKSFIFIAAGISAPSQRIPRHKEDSQKGLSTASLSWGLAASPQIKHITKLPLKKKKNPCNWRGLAWLCDGYKSRERRVMRLGDWAFPCKLKGGGKPQKNSSRSLAQVSSAPSAQGRTACPHPPALISHSLMKLAGC